MNPHETAFRTVIERNASVLEERETEKHMQECSDCRELSDFVQDLAAGVKEIGDEMAGIEEEHPSSPTIVAYAEGALDAKSAMHLRAHMLFCDLCAESYYLLKRMRAPSLVEVVIAVVEHVIGDVKGFLLKPIEISGPGQLVPVAALNVKGPTGADSILQIVSHVEGSNADSDVMICLEPTSGGDKSTRVQVTVDTTKPMPGWRAQLVDLDNNRLASVPLLTKRELLHTALTPGTYVVQVAEGDDILSEYHVDIQAPYESTHSQDHN